MTRGRGILSKSAASAFGATMDRFLASAEGLRDSKNEPPGCWEEVGKSLVDMGHALRKWHYGLCSLDAAEAAVLDGTKSIKSKIDGEHERIQEDEWDLNTPPCTELLRVTVSLRELYEVLIGEKVFKDGKAFTALLGAFAKLSAYAEACASLDTEELTMKEEESIQTYMQYCLRTAVNGLDQAIDYMTPAQGAGQYGTLRK